MRFAVAHKAASYLMVVAALFALLIGGGVPGPVALLGVVGVFVSWWWEAPRVRLDRWSIVWTIATLVVFVWVASTGVLTGDVFGSGATFLVWLTVVKAFNRRTSRDWQQLYLLAFLMLVAGSVLNEGLSFALAFLVFVISSTWAMILSHLRREMEDNFLLKHADDRASERVEVRRILESRRIVGGRFFLGTGGVSIGVFVLATIMFLSIPRVGAGFFMKGRKGVSFAGFKEGVKLGGHGTIKNDDTVVMRVALSGGYRYLHWRGAAFDHYEGGAWSRSREAPTTNDVDTSETQARRRRHILRPDEAGAYKKTQDVDAARLPGTLKQHVYVEPMDTEVLFGASMPIAMEHESQPWAKGPREVLDELRLPRTKTIDYYVWSQIERPNDDVLRNATGKLPKDYAEIFTQLPRTITGRTRALAAEITAGFSTDFDKAVAIETWLSTQLSYTLELAEAPEGQEPIDFFLFDRKKGHCEYFASAFAVLARSVGLLTREVNGFLGGEWNEYEDYIAVRAGDAHAWNEVYFPGYGWQTFDATPAGQDQLGRGGGGLGARFRRFLDTLKFQWTKWVIDYDLDRQLGFFKDVGKRFDGAGKWLKTKWKHGTAWIKANWLIAILIGAVILALALWRALRGRQKSGEAPRAKPRSRSPVAAIYAKVLHRLERRGLARAPAVTPRELARTAEQRALPYARALTELTEIYYAAQWGGEDGLVDRARSLAEEIETASLPR